ncbi:unnamed protein product, partial [Ilex paraguariensis]
MFWRIQLIPEMLKKMVIDAAGSLWPTMTIVYTNKDSIWDRTKQEQEAKLNLPVSARALAVARPNPEDTPMITTHPFLK